MTNSIDENLIDKPQHESDRFLEASIIAEFPPNGVEERDYDIVFAFNPYTVIAIKQAVRKLIRLGIVRITDGRAFLIPSSEWPKTP